MPGPACQVRKVTAADQIDSEDALYRKFTQDVSLHYMADGCQGQGLAPMCHMEHPGVTRKHETKKINCGMYDTD